MKHLKTIFACLLMTVLSIGQMWATEATLSSVSTKEVVSTNGGSVSKEFDGVTCTITRKSSNQPGFYTSSGIVRYYSSDVMTLSVASGSTITQIDFTMTSGSVGTASPTGLTGNTWKGSAESVSFTGSGTVKISSIKVTYSSGGTENPTLSSISVATAPTKITYTEGEYFDPTGLVITRSYSDNTSDTYTYADHTSYFSFSPSTSTALTTSNTSVTITYGGQSTTQAITVNAASSGQGGESSSDNFSWDLSKATYTTGTNEVTWSGTYATMHNSGTNATNYLGGDANNRTSSRFYKDNTLTITPAEGISISSVEFTATSEGYATTLQGSKWTNASAAVASTKVTVTPTNGANAISATVGGTCGFTNVKVYYSTTGGSGGGDTPNPTLSVNTTTIDFGTVNKGASVESKTVAVTFADLTGSVTYSGLTSPFSAEGTISNTGDEITIAANTATVGEYSQTLTVQSADDNLSKEVTVTMNVVEPYDGLKLTFDVSSNPGEWPTTNPTTTTNYTYTLDGVDYTFALNNAKSNSGYLMLTAVAKLGLPAISGYKLVKIEASNSGSCSTSTQVSVSSSDATKTDVTGGTAQTWSTTSSKYTYNLSGTEENTMYYLWIANKNCQLVELTLYYEEAEAPAVSAPTISGEDNFYASTEVTISIPEGAKVYYTTDGRDPKSGTEYTAPFTLTSTTTVKAIAKINEDYSQVAEKTFTKATVMTVAQARTAIDAGGDLSNKYVKGIISQIDSYNSDYSSITYWISDNGTTTNQLEVYSGLAGVVKDAFTSVDDLKVGEEVTINGTLKKYQSTYEFDKNNTIVAYRSLSPLAWSANAFTAEIGGNNTFPSLSGTTGLTVTYSSSDQTVATISADGTSYDLKKVGETTISASSAATDNYVATTKSYTLTVKAAVVRYSLSYEKNGGTSDATDSEGATETNLPNPLPIITKAGMNFGGWYTTSDFQQASKVSGGEELTENTTLYAQWLDPYTVAEALTMIAALEDNAKTSEVYVAGVVTDDEVEVATNVATYYIKDAGVNNSLEVYKGKGLNNANVSEGDIQESDQVVVYGQLQKYVKNSSTTPEIATGNYIYSRVRPTFDVTGVTLSATAFVRVGNTITLTPTIAPNNASDKAVTWASDAEGVATVDANGVVTGVEVGTAHITVTTHDGGFTASCTVTVAGARPTFAEDDHEWIKISNASKLVAGRYYVIAESANGKTATTSISGSVMSPVTSTFSEDKSVIAYNALGTNTAIFELGGNTTDGWTLYEVTDEENTGYFSGANASSFGWSESVAVTPISFNEDGKAILGDASGYRLLYNTNNGNPRFKTYSSSLSNSMLLPQLYMWAELSHSVTFDANGGVAESVPGVERTDEGKIIIPATEPTHTDASKVFAGWYTNEAGTGTKYVAGDEFATSADAILYAKWASVPTYTVTYIPGGSGTIPAVTSYPAGKSVTIATIEDLSNPGFMFIGWTVKDADQNVLAVDENNQFVMPAKNVTITAGWERQSDQKWSLVKQGDELEINAEYVIVCTSKSVALGSINTGSTHYGNPVEVVISGEILKGSSAMVAFTLVAGNGGSNYAFQNGTKYLMWSSGNSLDEKATLDNNSSWTVGVGEGNVATIANVGTSDRKMKYNSSQPRFACYTSGQTDLQLYKKVPLAEVSTTTAKATDLADDTDVTIHEGGKLTMDADKEVSDMTIEQGGAVDLADKTLTVQGDLVIGATMGGGASSQLINATLANIAVAGDIFFDITLGKGGTALQWHAFTVPFPVDALNGIYDLAGNKLTNEVNYAIMDYHGDIRAQGQYGWKKYRGILQPGTFYLMTVDGERTTYRFKMLAGADLVAAATRTLYEYTISGAGQSTDAGWNGVGNPTLSYGAVNHTVYVLNPETYTYEDYDAGEKNFVVGTPFFIQANAAMAAEGMTVGGEVDGKPYYAPARIGSNAIENVKVLFGNNEYKDRLTISAHEDALNEYEVGYDLVKMTMTSTPSVAQIFGKAYGSNLSRVYAPLNNSQASCDLTLYAPAAGEYTIAAPNEQDADVYLTLNGAILWNIALSPYTLDLTKGNTEGYGLILQANAPYVATGVDNMENGTDVQKVILNEHVYILRNGQCFDVTGKAVR